MAESSLISYLYAGAAGVFLITILDCLRRNRIKKETKKDKITETPYYSAIAKKNFKKTIPFGVGLGFLVYLQHFLMMLGIEPPWFIPFIQINPVYFYLVLLFTYAIFQFIAVFTNIPFFEKNRGMADGIFASFTVIQIIVFARFPLEFFPTVK